MHLSFGSSLGWPTASTIEYLMRTYNDQRLAQYRLLQLLLSPLFFRNHTRTSLDDVILPFDQCAASIHGITWLILFLSMLFWIFRVIRFIYHAMQYYDIKKFFNTALKIDDVSVTVRDCFGVFTSLICLFTEWIGQFYMARDTKAHSRSADGTTNVHS